MDKAPWPNIPDPSLRLDIIHELRRMARNGATSKELVQEAAQRLDIEQKNLTIVRYFVEAFHLGIKDAIDLYSSADSGRPFYPEKSWWDETWLDTAEQALRDAMYEELVNIAGVGIADKVAHRSQSQSGLGAVGSSGTRGHGDNGEAVYRLRNGQSWTLHLRKTENYWELVEGTVSSPQAMTIREAIPGDLPRLQRLYEQLHDEDHGSEADIAEAWRQMCENPALHCFVAEGGMGLLLGTCTLIVVPNLTRQARPYGLIENVVTDADNRKQGIGMALMRHALNFAWEQRCYKVMLLTSRTDEAVLRFYEDAGFQRGIKTGFVAKPPDA